MSKKLTIVAIVIISLCLMSASIVSAGGPSKRAGKSKIAHLYLFQKIPSGEWPVVVGGAWGKMKYLVESPQFCYVFNGHNLEVDMDYSLIYYADPWPGKGLICLGSGTANEEGNVHIMGCVDTGDLPAEYDENVNLGAKIWLVKSDDVDCDAAEMIAWDPNEYLFEFNLITFDDTDT